MRFGFLFIFVLSLFGISASAVGGVEGNGGDVVVCRTPADNPFEGRYSLDWLATYKLSNQNADLVAVSSWEASRDRLMTMLKEKSPYLAQSFTRFVEGMENLTDFSAERVWLEKPFGLADLNDENLRSKLPDNCYEKDEDKRPKIIQAVRRERQGDVITYFYDSEIYETMRRERPLQFSFLMVHEWLWDVASDVEVMRNVNRMLHSSATEKYSPEQFSLALSRLGLTFSFNPGFVPVCERSRPVRQLLEIQVGALCHDITADNLANIKTLSFDNIQPGVLRGGDFSGLRNLDEIYLDAFQLTDLPDGLFFNAPRLKKISVMRNKLKHLNSGAFPSSMNLERLAFDNNQIRAVDLAKFFNIEFLGMSHNQIATFDDVKVPFIKRLRAYGNPIRSATKLPAWSQYLEDLALGSPQMAEFDCRSLPSLKYLSFEGGVPAIALTRQTFLGCRNLTSLSLHGVKRPRINADAFADLSLSLFVLVRSDLTNLPVGILSSQGQLRWVALSYNKFDQIFPPKLALEAA